MPHSPESGPGPLPEDTNIPDEAIAAAPEVQRAERIMRRANQRLPAEHPTELPELTPAEREGLRQIEPSQVPEILSQTAARAAELLAAAKREVQEHPADAMALQKLERASQYADRIGRGYDIFLEKKDSWDDAMMVAAADRLLTEKEELEDLLVPPEHWAGTPTQETTTDETAAGSYEAAIDGLAHPEDAAEEELDDADPNDILNSISAIRNRIATIREASSQLTEAHDLAFHHATKLYEDAHDRFVEHQRYQQDPAHPVEHRELETERTRQTLRHIEESIATIEQQLGE